MAPDKLDEALDFESTPEGEAQDGQGDSNVETPPENGPRDESVSESQTDDGPQSEAPDDDGDKKPDDEEKTYKQRYEDMRSEFDRRDARVKELEDTLKLSATALQTLEGEDEPAQQGDGRVEKLKAMGYKDKEAEDFVKVWDTMSEPDRQRSEEQQRLLTAQEDRRALEGYAPDWKNLEAEMEQVLIEDPSLKYVKTPYQTAYARAYQKKREDIEKKLEGEAYKKALEKLKKSGTMIDGELSAPEAQKKAASENDAKAEALLAGGRQGLDFNNPISGSGK